MHAGTQAQQDHSAPALEQAAAALAAPAVRGLAHEGFQQQVLDVVQRLLAGSGGRLARFHHAGSQVLLSCARCSQARSSMSARQRTTYLPCPSFCLWGKMAMHATQLLLRTRAFACRCQHPGSPTTPAARAAAAAGLGPPACPATTSSGCNAGPGCSRRLAKRCSPGRRLSWEAACWLPTGDACCKLCSVEVLTGPFQGGPDQGLQYCHPAWCTRALACSALCRH